MAVTLISVLFVQEGVFCTNRIIVLTKSLYIERLYWGFGNLKKRYIWLLLHHLRSVFLFKLTQCDLKVIFLLLRFLLKQTALQYLNLL